MSDILSNVLKDILNNVIAALCPICRESCGVCGYLSASSEEEQELQDGKTYSTIDGQSFDCGRYVQRCTEDQYFSCICSQNILQIVLNQFSSRQLK